MTKSQGRENRSGGGLSHAAWWVLSLAACNASQAIDTPSVNTETLSPVLPMTQDGPLAGRPAQTEPKSRMAPTMAPSRAQADASLAATVQPSSPLDAGVMGEPADEDAGVHTDQADEPAMDTTDAGSPGPRGPLFELPPGGRAKLETLIPPTQLGPTENAVFIPDGRFFVVGAEGIYEITRSEAEPTTYSAPLFIENPGCLFGGITALDAKLYAACTDQESFTGELIVYDPSKAEPLVGRAPIQSESLAHFNGMAFGPDGALYLSNSLAVDSADASVVRVEIQQEQPLQLTQRDFIVASRSAGPANVGGGSFPNGIRFHGDTMYLVRGADVVAVPVAAMQPDAPLDIVYTPAGVLQTIDDFDIADERMWLTQFSAFRALGLPGNSELVVTDLQGDSLFAMELPFVASSTVVSVAELFGPPCILVTSFFDGGLYRVTFE